MSDGNIPKLEIVNPDAEPTEDAYRALADYLVSIAKDRLEKRKSSPPLNSGQSREESDDA